MNSIAKTKEISQREFLNRKTFVKSQGIKSIFTVQDTKLKNGYFLRKQ